jgi:hypothetical protein
MGAPMEWLLHRHASPIRSLLASPLPRLPHRCLVDTVLNFGALQAWSE